MFRWRGYISMGGCVLTGAIGGLTLPFVTLLPPILLDRTPGDQLLDPYVIFGFGTFAVGATILGMLGGLILWGIVRTRPKSPNLATVFD